MLGPIEQNDTNFGNKSGNRHKKSDSTNDSSQLRKTPEAQLQCNFLRRMFTFHLGPRAARPAVRKQKQKARRPRDIHTVALRPSGDLRAFQVNFAATVRGCQV